MRAPVITEIMQGPGLAEFETRYINIKDPPYRAKGDGVTNDGPIVMAAIANMLQNDVLFFPAGIYLLPTYVAQLITANIAIAGLGEEITTIIGPNLATNFVNLGASGNVIVKDIGFNTFDSIVHGGIANTDHVGLYNVKADTVKHLYDDEGFATTGDVDSFRVNNCKLLNISDVAIQMRSPVTKFISVTDNEFTTITGAIAVQLGSNDVTISNNCYIVKGNYFKDISGGAETHAILCYGQRAEIQNNVIDTVSNVGGSNCEGIYTKCLHSIILGNILIDAGLDSAAIVLKGKERGEAGESPYGYGNIVAENNIYYSSTRLYNGISLNVSDCLVTGNYIENAGTGINSIGEFGTKISLNLIYNSSIGIKFYASAENIKGISIVGNTIRETNAADAAGGVGIHLDSAAGYISNVLISDNIIDVIESSGTGIGLYLECTNNILNLTIVGNSFNDMDNGIDASLDGGTLTYVHTSDNLFDTVTSKVGGEVYGGIGSRIKDNLGFVTENGGLALNKATGGTIAHGVAVTPTIVNVVPKTAGVSDLNVNVDITNITVTFAGGGAEDFWWEAKVNA